MAHFLVQIHRKAEAKSFYGATPEIMGRRVPEEKFREADVVRVKILLCQIRKRLYSFALFLMNTLPSLQELGMLLNRFAAILIRFAMTCTKNTFLLSLSHKFRGVRNELPKSAQNIFSLPRLLSH